MSIVNINRLVNFVDARVRTEVEAADTNHSKRLSRGEVAPESGPLSGKSRPGLSPNLRDAFDNRGGGVQSTDEFIRSVTGGIESKVRGADGNHDGLLSGDETRQFMFDPLVSEQIKAFTSEGGANTCADEQE